MSIFWLLLVLFLTPKIGPTIQWAGTPLKHSVEGLPTTFTNVIAFCKTVTISMPLAIHKTWYKQRLQVQILQT